MNPWSQPTFSNAYYEEQRQLQAARLREKRRQERVREAAPDLLAACKQLVAQFRDRIEDPSDEEAITKAMRAVEKAGM